MSSSNSIRSVVVTVDVGSSSVRCIAYDVTGYDQNSGPYSIVPVTSSSQKRRSVRPSSGRIILDSEQDGTAHGSSVDGLLDTIDRCVTDVLESLPKTAAAAATADSLLFQVVAVGFSTFVMNLVGVDDCGRIVGATASVSYACSHAPEVHAEVEHLQR